MYRKTMIFYASAQTKTKMLRNLFFFSARRQIHVLATQNIIKPSSPTQSSLKKHYLSSMDQVTPSQYFPIAFYYHNKFSNAASHDITRQLRLSLYETLAQYYPFAGRLNQSALYVECNDEGVEFQEVEVKRLMSDVQENEGEQRLVFPEGLIWGGVSKSAPLLVIRVNKFQCGGVSIAVCLSHKLGDAKSFNTFMKSWATTARLANYSSADRVNDQILPHFVSHPIPDDSEVISEFPIPKKHWESTRVVFPNSKIAKMKEIVGIKSGLQNISRVEIITSLLYKCTTNALNANAGTFTPSVLAFMVNTRNIHSPPLPETAIGNFYWPVYIPISNESESDIGTLVGKIKKAKSEVKAVKSFDAMSNFSLLVEYMQNNNRVLWCSSLSRIGFYQVDFGWGNPSRVVLPDTMLNNNFILTDTPTGDGIEGLVSLEKGDMDVFRSDKEIIPYSS